jgi:TATA-binding protein-associated factor
VLMPRLWPFLHHTSSSVRRSALLTLQKLTELSVVAPLTLGPLQETLRQVWARGVLEGVASEVGSLIPRVWADLLRSARLETLLMAACPLFGAWLLTAMHPPRVPIAPNVLNVKGGGGGGGDEGQGQGEMQVRGFGEF